MKTRTYGRHLPESYVDFSTAQYASLARHPANEVQRAVMGVLRPQNDSR